MKTTIKELHAVVRHLKEAAKWHRGEAMPKTAHQDDIAADCVRKQIAKRLRDKKRRAKR